MTLRLLTLFVLSLGLGIVMLLTQSAPNNSAAAICVALPPLGGIPPQRPEWCDHVNLDAMDTHKQAANGWVDSFDHGEAHKDLSAAYAHGKANGDGCDIVHFSHNNHWMADVQGDSGQYPTMCGAWMRPDRTFTVQPNGTLVIEFEVASPIAGTRKVDGLGDAWPEFTVTTDPLPGNLRPNGTYLYESMSGYWTFGCRMQQSKHPICALYDTSNGVAGGDARLWEINQNGGDVASEQNGGPAAPGSALDIAWKGCTSTQDPDTLCRNKHRVELTKDGIKFFVNGVPGYSASFINNDMDTLMGGPVYVYFGDFAYQIEQDTVVRFHWDRLAINPQLLGEAPLSTPTPVSPTPTPTSTPTPTPTSTPTPTPTSTPTPTPASTPTPTPTSTPTPSNPICTVWLRLVPWWPCPW
jgi:cell division septation protein DedD